jgi:hypothetical protein
MPCRELSSTDDRSESNSKAIKLTVLVDLLEPATAAVKKATSLVNVRAKSQTRADLPEPAIAVVKKAISLVIVLAKSQAKAVEAVAMAVVSFSLLEREGQPLRARQLLGVVREVLVKPLLKATGTLPATTQHSAHLRLSISNGKGRAQLFDIARVSDAFVLSSLGAAHGYHNVTATCHWDSKNIRFDLVSFGKRGLQIAGSI